MCFQTWCPSGCWSECGHWVAGVRGLGGLWGLLLPGWEGLFFESMGTALVWGLMALSKGQAPGWVSLSSVQYNKFTAAGAQQLAASLRKCPHVETLA